MVYYLQEEPAAARPPALKSAQPEPEPRRSSRNRTVVDYTFGTGTRKHSKPAEVVPEEPQPDPSALPAHTDQARRDKTRDTAAVRAHRKPDLIEPLPLTNPDGVSCWKEPFFGQYEPRAQSAHVLGFERDPQQALYGFWALSGQGQGNHTKPLNGFPDLIPDPLSREAELQLLHAGAAAMNCYQPHVGCAACGIRVVGYENTDPRGDGIPNEKFSRVPITDGKFQRVFQATISTLELEASFPEEYRCVVSVYRPAHIADCPPLSVYEKYVHNDLATLCAKCAVAYKSSGTTPYSLVCGYSCGCCYCCSCGCWYWYFCNITPTLADFTRRGVLVAAALVRSAQ